MYEYLKRFLTYNNKDRSGAMILMCIIFILILVNLYLPYLRHTMTIDYSLFDKEIEKFEKTMDSINSGSHARFLKYRNEKLSRRSGSSSVKKTKTNTLHIVDINLADSSELIKLKGIGPAFASRIVKYRLLLGGYVCHEQLLEVYGMDNKRYLGIEQQLEITIDSVRKIDINTASFKEILKHPYISYEMVKEIVNYRKSNGGFSDVTELRNVPQVDSTVYYKLLPYLII